MVRETRQYLCEQNADPTLPANVIKTAAPPEDKGLLPFIATYSWALWCLHGKHSGNGYGFPFDRPLLAFAERLLELNSRLPEFSDLSPGVKQHDNPLPGLIRVVSAVAEDSMLLQVVEELRWRSNLFDRFRKVMRIAEPHGGDGLNDDGTAEAMSTIRQGVEQFRRELDEDRELSADPLSRKMAKQIDKYSDKLFADPIEIV